MSIASVVSVGSIVPVVTAVITSLGLGLVCVRLLQPSNALLTRLRTFRAVTDSRDGSLQLATLDLAPFQVVALPNVTTLNSLALLATAALLCIPLSTGRPPSAHGSLLIAGALFFHSLLAAILAAGRQPLLRTAFATIVALPVFFVWTLFCDLPLEKLLKTAISIFLKLFDRSTNDGPAVSQRALSMILGGISIAMASVFSLLFPSALRCARLSAAARRDKANSALAFALQVMSRPSHGQRLALALAAGLPLVGTAAAIPALLPDVPGFGFLRQIYIPEMVAAAVSLLSVIGVRASVQAFLDRSLIFWSSYQGKNSGSSKSKVATVSEKESTQLRADLEVIAAAPAIVMTQMLAIAAAGWAGTVPLASGLAAGMLGHTDDFLVDLVVVFARVASVLVNSLGTAAAVAIVIDERVGGSVFG